MSSTYWGYALLEGNPDDHGATAILHCTRVHANQYAAIYAMAGQLSIQPADMDKFARTINYRLKRAAQHSDDNEPVIELPPAPSLSTPYTHVQFFSIEQ